MRAPWDVFVSYSRSEETAAERVARWLRDEEFKVFFDSWSLVYGERWADGLQAGLEQSAACIVLIGQEGIDGWQWEEALIAHRRSVENSDARLIPVLLPGLTDATFEALPGWIKSRQRVDLRGGLEDPEGLRRLFAAVQGLAPGPRSEGGGPAVRPPLDVQSGVSTVPQLPPYYLERPEAVEPLKRALLTETAGRTGPAKVGIQGMPGVGKTLLAAAVANDPEVRAALPDGVLWITVGRDPVILELQLDIAASIGAPATFTAENTGKRVLREALRERSILLVLDDLWEIDPVEHLDVVGERGRLLVTTRNQEVLVSLGARDHRLEVPSLEQALGLLASCAGLTVRTLPAIAERVAEECGRLPLALAMIGSMVRLRPDAWADALDRLERADLDKIRQRFPGYPHPNLLRAIEVSIVGLDAATRERYLELAVLGDEPAVPGSAFEVLWSAAGLEPLDARDLIARLVARSLLLRDQGGRFRLQALQADYLRREAVDLSILHQRLVEAYSARCPGGWFSGPDDGYFFQRLPFHLAAAGRLEELRALLLDGRWLAAKLGTAGVNALLNDYNRADGGEPLELLQSALRLSAHVLARDPRQLAGQLLARLPESVPDARAGLIAAVQAVPSGPWLRPLWGRLNRAGSELLRTLEGHARGVGALAVLGDGGVLSGSDDRTLRLWDLATGEMLRCLEVGSGGVADVAAIDDRRAVCASEDGTLRLWDLETGAELRRLDGLSKTVRSVATLPGGRVVCAAADQTLRIWDIESGETVGRWGGVSGRLTAVAALGGDRVVSAADDGTLSVWSAASGELVHRLAEPGGWVLRLAALGEDRFVSGSRDGVVRIWDARHGRLARSLTGHSRWVWDVTSLADGRVASASADGTLRIWDGDTGQTVRCLKGRGGVPLSLASLPDGLLVSGSDDGVLRVWDPDFRGRGPDQDPPEGHGGGVTAVAELSDGRLISASSDRTLRLWDSESGRMLRVLDGHGAGVTDIARLTERTVVTSSEDGMLRIQDVQTGEVLRRLEGHGDRVTSVAALSGGRLASASLNGELWIWDLERGRVLRRLEGHRGGIKDVAELSGERVISSSDDRTLRIWSLNSGEQVRVLEGHRGSVWAVAQVSGSRLVSASEDRTVRVWDADSGEEIHCLTGHAGRVQDVAALDDRLVVSASDDRSLRVWNLELGEAVAVFETDSALWSVGGRCRRVFAGDQSGMVHLFELEGI